MAVNKENIHEFIPMVMIRKNEEYFSRSRKGSYEDENHIPQWTKAIQAKPLIAQKFRDKTVSFAKKGVPHEMRHLVWPAVVTNSLAITEQLYFELLERKTAGWLPEDVANQIDHICQLAGNAQHTAIGGDTDGQGGIDGAPDGIETVADYQKLGSILAARGYMPAEIANILYDNWQRFYLQWLPES